ncbi:MAG: hypothetical protein ACJ74O_13405 [Frankiaceae bacterium]|jgi:hypothetical protein
MALPSNVNTVTVTGTYVDSQGAPVQGSVIFTPPVTLTDPAADVIIVPKAITATLDGNGQFSVDLIATDDPDFTPNGWTYQVRESFPAGGGRTYAIALPLAVPAVEISDLAPAPPSQGVAQSIAATATLRWTGTDYAPTALKGATGVYKQFVGPVDPSSVTGVVLGLYDAWDPVPA